jgi:fibronectin type 3 domain-containing protein
MRSLSASGPWGGIASPSGTATSYSDTSVSAGTTYYYYVYANNSAGSSAGSNTASATTPLAIPAAPSNVKAGATGRGQIALSWSETSSGVTSFVVQRSTSGNGTYSTIATLSGSQLSYTDRSVSSRSTYYYRIQATNSAGSSPYSSVVSATAR